MKNSGNTYKRTFLLVLFSVLISTMVLSAQERENLEIYSLDQLTENTSFRSSLPNYIKPENINPLISQLKPSVYIKGGVVNIQGEKPVRAYLDINSLSRPIARNSAFDNVELVVITIENERDLSSRINLDNLSGFTKLKYIQIVCWVDCNQNQISTALISTIKNYVVIYSVEKQS
jgi:hypothetical protein